MADDPKEPEKPRPARPEPARSAPARPTPAREGAPPPARPEHATPPPARGAEEPAPPAVDVEPDVDRRTLEVDGVAWIVKVEGRGGGGASLGAHSKAPLLLLGFYRDEDEHHIVKEALVTGSTLTGLTFTQLEGALESAKPPPDPSKRPELFPGTASRRGRRGD